MNFLQLRLRTKIRWLVLFIMFHVLLLFVWSVLVLRIQMFFEDDKDVLLMTASSNRKKQYSISAITSFKFIIYGVQQETLKNSK